MKKEFRKKILYALFTISVTFFGINYVNDYRLNRSIESMYNDMYDIMVSDKKESISTIRSLEMDEICREMSIKYINQYYVELYNVVKLGSMKDIFAQINGNFHLNTKRTGETMVNFGCNSGTIIWLSVNNRTTITKLENRINTWIAEYQKE